MRSVETLILFLALLTFLMVIFPVIAPLAPEKSPKFDFRYEVKWDESG